MLRWAGLWTFLGAGGSGLFSWWTDLNWITWQEQLRYLAAVSFFLAIVAGSIFTLSRRKFYREEWSFILLLVTLGLFGISAV
jgi:hypothetical protein